MTLAERVDEFLQRVYASENTETVPVLLGQAVELLREAQAAGRGSAILGGVKIGQLSLDGVTVTVPPADTEWVPVAFTPGDRVCFIDVSNAELFAGVATVKQKTADGVHVHFDGDPETLTYVCDAEQLEKEPDDHFVDANKMIKPVDTPLDPQQGKGNRPGYEHCASVPLPTVKSSIRNDASKVHIGGTPLGRRPSIMDGWIRLAVTRPAEEAPVRMSMADLEPVKTPCELPKCWRWHAGGGLCSMLCGDPSCSFPAVEPRYMPVLESIDKPDDKL